MLGIHNLLGILLMFSKFRQIILLVFFDADHSFNRSKYWCNWVSNALVIICNLFYRFYYTNLLILDIHLQIFFVCNLFFNPSVHCPKISTYTLYILTLYLVFCTNQFLTSSLNINYSTEPLVGIIPGVFSFKILKF